MIVGGSMIASAGASGPMLAAIAVIAIAVIGYLMSRAIPAAPATAPDLKFNWNLFSETWRTIGFVARDRTVFNAVLGISWFWFFGLVFTAQLPNYTTLYLGGGDGVQSARACAVLDRHGHRFAAVRAAFGPQGRDRPRAVRLDRTHAVRHRPVLRAPAAGDRIGPRRRSRSSPRPATGASLSTSRSSACSPGSTSCRCSRSSRAAPSAASCRA